MLFLIKKIFYAVAFIFVTCIFAPVNAQISDDNAHEVEVGSGGNIKTEKPFRTKVEQQFERHAHLLWESRYVTEGRDNLSGKGISSASTELIYKGLTVIPWMADSFDTDYQEFNLNVIYGIKALDKLGVFLGYNRIYSRDTDNSGNDNELSVDLVYFYDRQFHVLASIYHSFETSGAFSEVAINKDLLVNHSLSINLRAILGFNTGYIVDGHNGLNHGQLRASVAYLIMEKLDANAYIGYNRAMHEDSQQYAGDELLRDFFWGGGGLSYRF